MKYIINKPNLSSLEKKYVLEALSSTWLSSGGKNTKIFEEKFAKYLGLKNALAVQSGTASLHLALKALDVTNKDYVVIPNFTCVSNISAASQCGAKIILVDVEPETLGMDFEILKKVLKKYKPKALQLVHVYGFPARDTLQIVKICKKNKIKIIEDSSEALGALINGKKVGSFGDINVTSIRSEKMIGVGEGAIVSTNNNKLFNKISLIASRYSPFRKPSDAYWKKYFVSGEGYNYLMPHLLGSIARAQIERFKNSLLLKKILVGKTYRKSFNINNIKFTQTVLKKHTPVFWLNSIYFERLSKEKIRKLGAKLKKKGIEVRSGFWPLNSLKCFKSIYFTENNITKKIFEKSLILPSSYDLKIKDIKKINNSVKELM